MIHSSVFKVVSVVLLTGLLFVCFNMGMFNIFKTLYSIAKVSPYEQVVEGAPSIFILGDSTGYGTGADKKEESVAGLIGQNYPEYTIKNNSKNGRTIGELVPVVEKIEGEYKLILLQIGGNDILQSRDVAIVEKELRQIVTNLKSHTENIVMISSGNIGAATRLTGSNTEKFERQTREFREMFIKVSVDTPLTYVDLFLEPENDPFVSDPKKYFAWDGLHPTSAGYAFWYTKLGPVLRELL